jgi:site-specific DNA recombinase
MSQKTPKYNPNKKYNFDLEKWEYIEKKQYVESKANPVAIIYVRVSDQKQVDEWNGLESQEATCRRWAESKGIKILEVFSDGGKSGADMSRKWLSDAIEYLKKENAKHPRVSYFLCTEVSRISRSEDTTQTGELKKRIESTGVTIITTYTGRNISSINVNDSFITDIDIAIAKSERLRIRERSLNGSKAKLLSWYWIFDVPAGYERTHVKNWTKTEKLLQKVEPQASIIKEWLEMFANGVLINQSQLLQYFNDRKLKSNYHSPNPWKLTLTFIKRLFEVEKLYFYAGYILYPNPNYGVTKPVEAVHMPLITLSTANKILKRLKQKWWLKAWPRKDTSDLYPLRWMICCPYCNYSMTARPSKGWTGKIYHYYGCNRKDCKQKENINVEDMHRDFESLLATLTPKKGVLNLLDGILQETINEKNKVEKSMIQSKQRRIQEIDIQIEEFPTIISKLTRIEVIQKIEEKRANLEQEKEILENEVTDKGLNEKDFTILYSTIKNLIEDPLSIWELWSTELKMLLVSVLFWWKLYYKKNEGYQTPHISALYRILDHLNDGKVTSGAGDATRTRNQQLGRLWL